MTKPVEVILVGRKLLQKFYNVIFVGPLHFMMLMSTVNLVIIVNDWEKFYDVMKCLKPDLSCRNF